MLEPDNTHRWGTMQELTQKEHMSLYLCREPVESKLVKLETSRTVKLPPTVSVLWLEQLQRLWRNWLSGRIRHQRSTVRIQ